MTCGLTCGPAMLNHPMFWDIHEERPADKADICSWMYIRKVSEDQHPYLRIVSHGVPLRCMAMALPTAHVRSGC